MGANGDSVRCAGGSLGQHRHICAFFNGIDDEHRVLRSFIKEGFDRGDKAFHIVDPELQGEHLKRLAEAGIDVKQAMGTGQLDGASHCWKVQPVDPMRFLNSAAVRYWVQNGMA